MYQAEQRLFPRLGLGVVDIQGGPQPADEPVNVQFDGRPNAVDALRRRIALGPGTINGRPHDVSLRCRTLRSPHQGRVLPLRRRHRGQRHGGRIGLGGRRVGQLVQLAADLRIGRAAGPRRLEQALGVDVLAEQFADGLRVFQARKVARQEAGGEISQAPIHGHELDIDRDVVARRQQHVVSFEHRADFVERDGPDLKNTPVNHGRRQPTVGQAILQGGMHAGVEEQRPVPFEHRLGRPIGKHLRIGPRQQNDFFGQQVPFGQAEFRFLHQLQERLASHDITLAVRNVQPETGQAAVPPDHPPQNTGRHQKGRRTGRPQRVLQFAECQRRHVSFIEAQRQLPAKRATPGANTILNLLDVQTAAATLGAPGAVEQFRHALDVLDALQ